jgi:argininosuccinate lyase
VAAEEEFPAPVYRETVLAHNFEDAKKYFLDYLIQIHDAHTRMLERQEILSHEDAAAALASIAALDRSRISQAVYDGRWEDLFFYVEHEMGEPGARIHVARSRNDIAITLFRMALRAEILRVLSAAVGVCETLLSLADRHLETVMPAHTHTQPAQPTTLAHYLMAVVECLCRDLQRLRDAFATVNRSPMGACAITTTGFPIDRDYVAELLGFEGLAENSYGAIASIDYATAAASAVAVLMVNLGKSTQDLLLWSTREFGYIRLSEGFVQSSSIMPQKRNPVALEHTRILASRALGEAQAVLTCAHNTPFGDINDSEDDLQPLIFAAFGDAVRALRLYAGSAAGIQVDVEMLRRRAGRDFLTVTELADTLVRVAALSFREAHTLVSDAVKRCGDRDDRIVEAILEVRPELNVHRADLDRAMDPRHFVEIRTIAGGPAPREVHRQMESARKQVSDCRAWLSANTPFPVKRS